LGRGAGGDGESIQIVLHTFKPDSGRLGVFEAFNELLAVVLHLFPSCQFQDEGIPICDTRAKENSDNPHLRQAFIRRSRHMARRPGRLPHAAACVRLVRNGVCATVPPLAPASIISRHALSASPAACCIISITGARGSSCNAMCTCSIRGRSASCRSSAARRSSCTSFSSSAKASLSSMFFCA